MFSMFQSFIFIFFTSIEMSLDKLVVAKLFKKFPAIYGTRTFMNMLIEVRYWAIYSYIHHELIEYSNTSANEDNSCRNHIR